MKIIKQNNFTFKLFVLVISLICTITPKQSPVISTNLDADYHPSKSPLVIKEIFSKVKKYNLLESDLVKECEKLIYKSKYNDGMKQLWDELKSAQGNKKPIDRPIFSKFLTSINESIYINGTHRKCDEIMNNNLMEHSEILNTEKQRELDTILFPYFGVSPGSIKGKKIITAFLGVHRDSDPVLRDNLLPKLNGRH